MPKTNRSGQALTLTPEQLDAIMLEVNPICRAALSTCRYTAAHITEALSLPWENVTPTDIVIPKAVTKKKMRTRTIPMNPKLCDELAHRGITRAKGAAGLMCCGTCANVYDHKRHDCSGRLVPSTTLDVSKFVLHTDESIRKALRTVRERLT